MKCERCSKDAHMLEPCNYCNKTVCVACIKSSRSVSKTIRRVICKDCWTKMEVRRKFKSEKNPAKTQKYFAPQQE